MSNFYHKSMSALDAFVPRKLQPLWQHPAGPKTIFFWAPAFKWGLVMAGIGDLARPAESLSVPQSAALAATGIVWSRYSLVIIPKNYSLFSVNVFVAITQLIQLYRAYDHKRSLTAKNKTLTADCHSSVNVIPDTGFVCYRHYKTFYHLTVQVVREFAYFSAKMARDLDIILFGATGFTGKHAVPIISKLSKDKNRKLTWGIAGRSEKKLKEMLGQCEKEMETSLEDIPIIIADVQDENSLTEMARKARIIINCCGPYRFYGEPVVKACAEEGTHHVDVSGEPQYMERMQLKYNDQAREKGIYIVSACGFDSIPADLGVVFLQKKFNGTVNSVVTYLDSWEEGHAVEGPALNYGTWESAVYGLAHAKELGILRKQLFPSRLPSYKPKLQLVTRPHKRSFVEGWAVPFPGSDRSVIKRSQRLFYDKEEKRPVQVETYCVLQSIWTVVQLIVFGFIFQMLVKFQFGRDLLLKYPEKFSGGLFSRESPSEEKIENQKFRITLRADGWKESLPEANDQYTGPPNKQVTAEVKGTNPGYGATCVCLVLSAITILEEPTKMPRDGGVYPPGYAFAKTSLIEELNDNGVTFDVVSEKELPTSKY